MSPSRTPRAAALLALLLLLAPAASTASLPPLPPSVSAQVPFESLETLYAEDFEAGDGGYTAQGSASWQHGAPAAHVVPPEGTQVWGTNLAGAYGNLECGAVHSPPIDLSGQAPVPESGVARAARLSFRHWQHLELRWDGGVVQASGDDGATWRVLQPFGGYDDSLISSTVRGCLGVAAGERVFTGPTGSTPPPGDQWRTAEFDLTGFLGGEVLLRWVVATDTSGTRLGWYVDDVTIDLGVGAGVRADVPARPAQAEVPFTALHSVYYEDFEAGDGDWTEGGTGDWAWGTPEAPPLPPTGQLRAWGTVLEGDYAPSACATLVSPPLLLPGPPTGASGAPAEAARLSFQLWRHLRSGYDGAQLQASADGGKTWSPLVPHQGYDRTLTAGEAQPVRDCLGVGTTDRVWSGPTSQPAGEAWLNLTADLTPYLGTDLRLRLVFASGATGVVARGVYLGHVQVQVGPAARADLPTDTPDPGSELGSLDGLARVQAPGWTVEGDGASWNWGVPTTGPVSTRPVFATNLHGPHGANECAAIVSPPLDTSLVAGLGRLTLAFEHYFKSANNLDAGVVQVSRDGGPWVTLTPLGGYSGAVGTGARACLANGLAASGFFGNPTGNGYEADQVLLTGFESDALRVRFLFTTSATTHDLGWYVRNVQLHRGAVPLTVLAAPAPLPAAEPLQAKADPALLAALPSADGAPLQVLVSGSPHGQRGPRSADRGLALAALRADAAPFFDAVEAVAAQQGAQVLRTFASVPAVQVAATPQALAALAALPGVRALERDHPEAVRLIEPLPAEGDAGGPGTANTEGRAQLQAEDLWALGYRGAGLRLAVIDTGIDPAHEAFRFADGSSRIAAWADFNGTDPRPAPFDDHGHGTHVAATAAGSTLYDDPVFGRFQEEGVAPEATLLVAKFLSRGGSGSLGAAVESLEWAFAEGADVTSNSWGSACGSSATATLAAVRTLTDQGMLSVFAAGNSGPGGSTIGSPACSESALSVGAVDSGLGIASFSSRGPCRDVEVGGPSRLCPDVVAKGVLVRSAIPRGDAGWAHPTGYRTWNGTSMATPHVAGAAVLSEQAKRALTGEGWSTSQRHERRALQLDAVDLGAAGPDNSYGHGLPQLLALHGRLTALEPEIQAGFNVSRAVVRQGDTTVLSFNVTNLAGRAASGLFRATLDGPDGSSVVLAEQTVDLGILEGASLVYAFTVDADTPMGDFVFRGTFQYAWTDPATGEPRQGVVERVGGFRVNRVAFALEWSGLAERAEVAALQRLDLRATNVGNEPAGSVVVEFTVPKGYEFLPGGNFDPRDLRTRYADPRPDTVLQAPSGRVTLIFAVGVVAPGETFRFTANLLPLDQGHHLHLDLVKFKDGGNRAYATWLEKSQVVVLPALPLAP